MSTLKVGSVRLLIKTMVFVFCTTLLVDRVHAQSTPSHEELRETANHAYAVAYELVLDEQWDAAQKALKSFLEDHRHAFGAPWWDDAEYWLCFVNEKKGGDLEDVFECYNSFMQKNNNSRWADDAKASTIRIARLLVKEGKPEYGAVVESMQKSDNEEVALTALYALQNIGDEKALETIVSLYERSESERLKERIVYILGNFDTPEVDNMLADIASSDASTKIRKNAAHALGNRGGRAANEALMQVIEKNGDIEVQKAAVYALGNSGGTGNITYLRQVALTTNKRELGQAATYAIRNAGGIEASRALRTILEEGKLTEVRKAALNALGHSGDASAIDVLVNVALEDPSEELQKAAVYALSNTRKAHNELMEIFESTDSGEVRRASLYALGNMRDDRSLEFLTNVAINHDEEEIAKIAAYALANGGGELFEVFEKTPYFEVKKAILHRMVDDVDALISILENENEPELRRTAIQAMGNADDNELVPVLLDVAKNDSDIKVRKAAITALGHIGSSEAQKALLEILEQD